MQQAAAGGRQPGSLMVRGNKFKPAPAATTATDANAALEQPAVADKRRLEVGAASRPPPQDGCLGLLLGAARSCGNGATEAPDPVLPAPHNRAGLKGGARLAGAGGRGAKHRIAKGAGLRAAPAACIAGPDLLRKAAQSSARGACAGAAAVERNVSATAAASAHPARPGPDRAAADAGNTGKRKRQKGHAPAPACAAAHAPASALPTAMSPGPRPRPGAAVAPARKRRRGAPGLAALSVRSPAGESAQTQPAACNGVLAKPGPAVTAVRTEVQPPTATREAQHPGRKRVCHQSQVAHSDPSERACIAASQHFCTPW